MIFLVLNSLYCRTQPPKLASPLLLPVELFGRSLFEVISCEAVHTGLQLLPDLTCQPLHISSNRQNHLIRFSHSISLFFDCWLFTGQFAHHFYFCTYCRRWSTATITTSSTATSSRTACCWRVRRTAPRWSSAGSAWPYSSPANWTRANRSVVETV